MPPGITAPEGDIFDIVTIRGQADYYASLIEDLQERNPGGSKRFKRAAIALRFMAAFIESHGDQAGLTMIKQWAGVS